MRLTVQRAALLEALAHVRGCVPHARSCADRPILGCFHIDAREGELVVTGTDALNVGARFTVPANVDRSGAIAAPVAEFFPIVAALRDGEVRIERDGLAAPVTLASGRSRYQIEVLDPALFPVIKELEREGDVEIPAWLIAKMVPIVEASIDSGLRENYAGAHFKASGGKLVLSSTDGHRITSATHDVDTKADVDVVIPSRGLRELSKLAERAAKDDANAVVALDVSSRKIVARHGCAAMVSSLIEASFPHWRSVVPSLPNAVNLGAEDVVVALRALRSVAERDKEKYPVTLFSFESGVLRLLSRRVGANGSEEIPVDLDASAKVALNTNYALDAFASVGAVSGEVRLEVGDELGPVVLRPAEDGPLGVFALVMPTRW